MSFRLTVSYPQGPSWSVAFDVVDYAWITSAIMPYHSPSDQPHLASHTTLPTILGPEHRIPSLIAYEFEWATTARRGYI